MKMLKKLSEYEILNGFNQTASALIKENNLQVASENDFNKLFPDQITEYKNPLEFLESTNKLKNTDEFVDYLEKYNKDNPICVAGDYDKR